MKYLAIAGILAGFGAHAQVVNKPIDPSCTSYFSCQAQCSSASVEEIVVSEGATKVEAFQNLQQQCWTLDRRAEIYAIDKNGNDTGRATMDNACVKGP